MIEFSLERLYHFTCKSCNKWWSIGDWTPTKEMYCPHCGHYHNEIKDVSHD